MKKTIAMICAVLFAQFAFAESEVVDGVTWYYSTYEDYNEWTGSGYRVCASITSGADKYSGNLTVPATLGGYQVRRIGGSAFYGCSGLTGITLPSGVVQIDSYAFQSCSGLLNVSLPGTLTFIGYDAFYGCSGLASVVIPDSVTSMDYHAFENCSALQSVALSRNLTSIPSYCFNGCSSLQSIVFPAGLKSIGEYAFYDCTALADVVLPNGLTSIGSYAFYNCDSFTRFDIPATVESIGTHMIRACDNLKTITVAAGNSNCKVVNNCLVSYSGSTLLAVPFGCATVDIPQGVTAIPESMFNNDDNLVSVTIPQGVTSIGSSAFYNCNKLAAVEIPVGCTMIGNEAFYACDSLTQVSLPDGLTSIGSYAFYYCHPAEIILPASVTAVGSYAFGGGDDCTSRRVVLLGAPPSGIANSDLLSSSNVSYPREHGAAWLEILNNINKFNGYNQTNKPEVEYVSVAVRESDPTILDVVYRVKSAKPTVKVRSLAFKDGVRSFANVVRPETFIEGTEAHVGDAISANAEHKLTWRVSSDWQIDLAKVKFEVLAVEEDLLPLELVTIPANGTNKAMEISWNAINADWVFDALLWLYADKDSGLILSDGILRDANTGNVYVSRNHMAYRNDGDGSYFDYDYYDSDWGNPTKYVFSKMGFSTLYGDELSYAKKCTRMGLRPSGTRQYAYRWIEAE